MTAFELNDLMMSWYGVMGQDSTMYLALVSGYLLVAYSIGSNLTFSQVAIINVFFTVWAGMHVASLISEMGAVMEIQAKLIELGAFSFQSPQESSRIILLFATIQSGGIIAALYFMWSVRHTKTE